MIFDSAVEDIFVDSEHGFVNSGVDLIKLYDVDERLDIGPVTLGWVSWFFVSKRPELAARTWKLRLCQYLNLRQDWGATHFDIDVPI